MKITIAWIGKTKEPAIQALTDEYLKRLGRYANVEGVALKDETALLKFCGRGARPHMLVLLDGKGKQLSSEELAGWLHDHQVRNALPLLFGIGPADGFSDEAALPCLHHSERSSLPSRALRKNSGVARRYVLTKSDAEGCSLDRLKPRNIDCDGYRDL